MNWLTSLGPSLLMVLGGIITWLIKSRIEELRATEEKLRADRRRIYKELLSPYIGLFADISPQGQQKAIQQIKSREYRETTFDFNLFGSDEVIKAHIALMQHFYESERAGQQNPKEMFKLYGGFLLAIRKSLGNKKTKLDEFDMLRAMIKDIDTVT